MMQKSRKNILIIAGEPSGDMRGAELLRELKKDLSGFHFWGVGGDRMAEEGVELLEHTRNLSIVGVLEALKNFSKVKRQYRECVDAVNERKPAAAILIDYPGFNLSLAKYLHKNGVPVIYYVIPQVWAWGHGRVGILKKHVDKLIVLFEFEKRFLSQHGLQADFVGHPLVDNASSFIENNKTAVPGLAVALLPGSRRNEISMLLPVILEAAKELQVKKGKMRFALAESSNVDRSLYDSQLNRYPGLDIRRIKDNTFEALSGASFAIVTSGTATLETALMKVPMVIIYKASLLTYMLYRLVIRIPFLGLTNILAGKEIAPEFLQFDAVPGKISGKILEMLDDPEKLKTTREELKKVSATLGARGAAKRAAASIARFLSEKGIA